MTEIDKTARTYLRECIALTVVLYIIGYAVSWVFDIVNELNMPLIVSALFTLVCSATIGLLWQWVATSHKDMLTTFYTATSGFRMLLALVVLTVVYLIVGREAMLPFVMTFVIFYFISIGHHSIYFARKNKTQ